jgi:hypothetical protein
MELTALCTEAERGNTGVQMRLAEVTEMRQFGDLLVFLSDRAENILLFDTSVNRMVSFAENKNFKDGVDCKLYLFYLTCKYTESSIAHLRTFMIQNNELFELTGVERDVLKIIKWNLDPTIEQVQILQFAFDSIIQNQLSIIFQFDKKGYSRVFVQKATLLHNPSVKDDTGRLDYEQRTEKIEYLKERNRLGYYETSDGQPTIMVLAPFYRLSATD